MNTKLLSKKHLPFLLLGAIGTFAALYLIAKPKPNPYLSTYARVKQEIAQKKQKAMALIREQALNDSDKNSIKGASITQLKQFIYDQQYSVTEILLTFIETAINQDKGYLCDVCFDEAIAQAKILDQKVQENNEIVKSKPLFGIPVSMKDTFIAPNTYQSFCVASKAQQRSESHGIQSFLITEAGGIVFAKTTLPQFGFSFESLSHLFGRALHPQNPNRTAGGSSGGEGGLIAVGGSPLGLGSDSGGSIRIPAHFCGLYGYKPSSKRLNMRGQAKGVGGWDGIRNIASCYGPMAQHFTNLLDMMEALTTNLDKAPVTIKDINFIMKPFDRKKCYENRKFKIGVLRRMNMMLPCKSAQRAIDETIVQLQKQGHEIIEFDIDQSIYNQAYQIGYYVMLGDGRMKAHDDLYQGEPFSQHFANFVESTKSCRGYKRIKQFLLKQQNRLRELMRWKAGDHGLSYYEMLQITAQLAGLQVKMAQIWDELGIDALISPVTAGVAVPHDTAMHCFSSICYTFVWNMLDFSCGSVPITQVREDEQLYNEPSQFGAKDIEYKMMEQTMKYSANLPVGIQVITRPYEDEICLNVMRQCKDA